MANATDDQPSMFSDESSSFFSSLMGMVAGSGQAGGDKAMADSKAAAVTTPPVPDNMETLPGMGPYLAFCRQDKDKAWALYSHGQAIRKELGLDTILADPYPHWETLKTHYQKNIHGRSKNNEVVLVEGIGRMDLKALKEKGVTRKDIVRHYCLFFEKILQGNPEQKVLMVYDLDGLGLFSVLNGDFLKTVSMLSDCLGALYPRVITKYALVRPPSLFEKLWGLVSGVLPAGARNDCLLCKNADDLEALIERSNIPTEYGGSSPHTLGESAEMQQLAQHVLARNGSQ